MDDERLLIEEAKRCNPIALDTIYQRHYAGIHQYIYYQVGNITLAEDLASEVFVRALEALPRYTFRGTPVVAWLYRIAHNLVIDYRRRQSRRNDVPLEEYLGANQEGMDHIVDQHVERETLRRALQVLTDDQRQVLLLRFAQDLDNREIAAILGKTEGAVKALQHRALAALRRHLVRQEINA